MVNGETAGFLMANPKPEAYDIPTDFSLSEFFVLPKFRRRGIGRMAAFAAFDMHRGKWQLTRDPRDRRSVAFWDAVVCEYTQGQYEVKKSYPNDWSYDDGVFGDIFFFTTP
jgi:predicted acetyltransferase